MGTSPPDNWLIAMLSNVESRLGKLISEKLPALAPPARESLARFIPWVYIVFGALGLIAWLAALGALAAATGMLTGLGIAGYAPFWLGPLGLYVLIPGTLVLGVVGGVMMLSRQAMGWYLVFLSELIDLVLSALGLQFVNILFSAVLVYLLFQIREHYR